MAAGNTHHLLKYNCLLQLLMLGLSTGLTAATLPEDRTDFGFTSYYGDKVRVNGPVLLVRKKILDKYSVSANYKEDNISGASVDVRTQASSFSETRKEITLEGQGRANESNIILTSSFSDEPDYESSSFGINVSHNLFSDLLTLKLGFHRGWDTVGQINTDLDESIDRHFFNLGLNGIFSKFSIFSIDYKASMAEGKLENPYRNALLQGIFVPEQHPGARLGHSLSLSSIINNKNRSVSQFGYRYFRDSWSVTSNTFNITYTTPVKYFGPGFILESHIRYHTQSSAYFYSDNALTVKKYISRDKELSDFNSIELGALIHYDLSRWFKFSTRQIITSFGYTSAFYEYDNFTDLNKDQIFNFRADLIHTYFTVKY